MEDVCTFCGASAFGLFGDKYIYTLYSDIPSVRLGCIPPHSRARTTGLLINTCKEDEKKWKSKQEIFLRGHWYFCFKLPVMSALGFNTRMDSLTCMIRCLCATDSWDSPLVRHQLTSRRSAWRPSHFDPHTLLKANYVEIFLNVSRFTEREPGTGSAGTGSGCFYRKCWNRRCLHRK